MYIINILCDYNEYEKSDGDWVLKQSANFMIDSHTIFNMLDSSTYFPALGGFMECAYNRTRRFGLMPTNVSAISVDESIKRTYSFNYNQAQV